MYRVVPFFRVLKRRGQIPYRLERLFVLVLLENGPYLLVARVGIDNKSPSSSWKYKGRVRQLYFKLIHNRFFYLCQSRMFWLAVLEFIIKRGGHP